MRRIEHKHGNIIYGVFEVVLDDYHVLRILPAEIAGVPRMADSSHMLRILVKAGDTWKPKYSVPINRGQMEKIRDSVAQAIVEDEERSD